MNRLAFPLIACLALASCKLPKGASFEPSAAPLSGVAGNAALDLPFLELTGAAAPSKALLFPEDAPYTLRPGDVLEIDVVDVPGTATRSVVLPDGMLYFDAAKGVKASGRTVAQIEEALSEQLGEVYSFPIVSANMYDVQGNRYTVLGQVKNPGSYPLRQPATLIDAIASAGGLHSANLSGRTKDLADLGRSVLIRDGQMMPINFRKLIEGGDMMHNVYMKPGDYVFLPAAGSEKVYVLGSVNSPTAFPYSSRVTLVSAVAAARGIREEAYASGLVLIRGSFHEPKLAGVNLRKIMRGEALNFHLRPGDIVWVPKKPWNKLNEYAKLALGSVAASVALNQSYEIFGEEERQNDNRIDSSANSVDVVPEPVAAPAPPAPAPEPVFQEPAVLDPGPAL